MENVTPSSPSIEEPSSESNASATQPETGADSADGGPAVDRYAEVPYKGHAIPLTHPDRLATAASIWGLEVAPTGEARVLEIGCGDGSNLVPMAAYLPESHFVGIDRSADAISKAKFMRGSLELKNVQFETLDLADLDDRFGTFDYVLCHGLYSWISEDERAALLTRIASLLTPKGVAYVSYNCQPGWRIRGIVRELAQGAAAGIEDPLQQVEAVRERATLFASTVDPQHPYAALIRAELEVLKTYPDHYIAHEYLAPHNRAFYLGEFVARLEAAGLKHVDDLVVQANTPAAHSIRRRLQAEGMQGVALEEAVDSLSYRSFRASLICRADREVATSPSLSLTDGQLFLVGAFRPKTDEPLLGAGKPLTFVLPNGVELTSSEPHLKAALLKLGQLWPLGIPFPQLWQAAQHELAERRIQASGNIEALAHDCEELVHAGHAEVRAHQPRIVREVSQQPKVPRVVHLLGRAQGEIVNALHDVYPLDPFARLVIGYLDGETDLRSIMELVMRHIEAKQLALPEGAPAADDPAIGRWVEAQMMQTLNQLAMIGVLKS